MSKPTKEAHFWMYFCLAGAGFGYYLVDTGIPQGLFLGYICILNVGKYIEKYYAPRKTSWRGSLGADVTTIHWREEYIRLKGWDSMTDIQRHVFTKKIKSQAMQRLGDAMKKELAELKAKHPDNGSLVNVD